MDIEEMIEQAYYRHPKPEEIFEEPWDELVDPKQFYSDLTRGASLNTRQGRENKFS